MSVPAPAQAERRIPIPRLGRLTKDAHHPQHQSCTGGVAYLRLVWLDYISLLVVAGLTTGLYWSPMYYPGHQIISIRESSLRPLLSVAVHNPQGPDGLVYPAVEEPLPSWLCGVAVTVVPLMIIAAFQLKFRSLWDCHAGQLGLLKTAVVTSFVTTLLKHFIGGMRPNFLSLCQPNLDVIASEVNWVLQSQTHGYLLNTTVCQGSQHNINKGLQGFPSGHTSSAFGTATFLAFYLNGKLKTFADYTSDFWVVIITIAPLILASLIAGAQFTSHQHHAHEIFAGMIIGLTFATIIYRSVYASVFDFRFNHIPLAPSSTKMQLNYDRTTPHLDGKILTDADHLVFWSWWKQVSVNERVHSGESLWPQSLRSLNVMGMEYGVRLFSNNQRGKHKHKESGALFELNKE